MNYTIAIDLILTGLLLVTIFYASLLSKKIHAVKENRIEMEVLLTSLNDAIEKAETGLNKLQIASSQNEYALQNQIKKATALKTDLEYFCEKADQTVDRLDKQIEEKKSPDARRPSKPILNIQTLR